DRIRGTDLIVVHHRVRDRQIDVRRDERDGDEEGFSPRGIAAVDRVQEDGGSAVVGRRIPGEGYLAVSAHRLQILRGRWWGRKEQSSDRRSVQTGLTAVPSYLRKGEAGRQAS